MVQEAQKESLKSVSITLPKRRWSIGSHVQNIDYGIEKIRAYPAEEAVVAYRLVRGPGVRETRHEVMPLGLAKELSASYERFRYITLDTLLQKKADIQKGKYKVNDDGLIIGFSDSYRKELGLIS